MCVEVLKKYYLMAKTWQGGAEAPHFTRAHECKPRSIAEADPAVHNPGFHKLQWMKLPCPTISYGFGQFPTPPLQGPPGRGGVAPVRTARFRPYRIGPAPRPALASPVAAAYGISWLKAINARGVPLPCDVLAIPYQAPHLPSSPDFPTTAVDFFPPDQKPWQTICPGIFSGPSRRERRIGEAGNCYDCRLGWEENSPKAAAVPDTVVA